MANISVNELQGVLQQAGIQPNFDPRDVADLQAEDKIAEVVKKETDPAVAKAKENYLSQIKKIADMDNKLAGVYSDANSNLFIEHALQREQLLSGASDVGYNAANRLYDTYTGQQQLQEELVGDYTGLYNRLRERRKGSGSESAFQWLIQNYLTDKGEIEADTDEYAIDDILSYSKAFGAMQNINDEFEIIDFEDAGTVSDSGRVK